MISLQGSRKMDNVFKIFAVLLCSLALLAPAYTGGGPHSGSVDAGNSIEQAANKTTNDIHSQFSGFFHDSRSKLYRAFYNLSSYLPLNIEYAETVGPECDVLEYNSDYYAAAGLIQSACLILLGLLFAFLGYRLIKIVLFLIGFIIGGFFTYVLILGLAGDHIHETWVPYTAVSLAVLVGVLCGTLTICVYYIGIFLAGASIGFLLTWLVLSAIDIPFFRTHIYVPVLGAVVGAVIFGLLSLWVQKWFFMLGTAILGSFMMCWGLDYYLELAAMVYYLLLFAEHRSKLHPCWYSWMLVPLFVISAITAFIVQAALTGRKYDHKKELKGICCGKCKKRRTKENGKTYMELKSQ